MLNLVSVSLQSIIHSYVNMTTLFNETIGDIFPSPYGVSFILTRLLFRFIKWDVWSFRLLTEYHSFLQGKFLADVFKEHFKFPSPYGVSFILTCFPKLLPSPWILLFPSPYGVSFILTLRTNLEIFREIKTNFRLLTEYHSFLPVSIELNKLSQDIISVSLRSIIHSYYYLPF